MSKTINVGFIGNPNCGKTTLFNAFTGANLKVANWPGVTVEKKEGYTTYEGEQFKLVDLPGIYSLTSYTMEEKVSRECIMSDEIDVIVDVVDASCLERNLYLTLQWKLICTDFRKCSAFLPFRFLHEKKAGSLF